MNVHIENPAMLPGGPAARSAYCGAGLRDVLSHRLREDAVTLEKLPDVTCVECLVAYSRAAAARSDFLSSAAQAAHRRLAELRQSGGSGT